jgi:MYXO-CTERM domain-containing protein
VGFVMMDTGNGVNVSSANAQTAIFGARAATQAGLNQFYTENSYGGLSFTGEILGPATITTLGTCQQSAITQIENAWANHFGKTFQHWMTYIGGTYSACGWSGIGGEGTAARPASGSWYNASTGCTVLNQEVGHNLGLMHSNSLRCSGASFIDDLSTCSGAEYGDRHTVMGSGCAHLTAYEKWYEGFFGACNGVRASVSGTYTLLPTEIACDGVQALQIPMPKTRPFRNTQGTTTTVNLSKYYLELRTKTGIDGNEAGPMVLVIVGGEVPVASKTSEFSWVLDMNPSTTNSFDGMSKGQSFTDPAGGVSFTVSELDANHASIDVTIANGSGSPTCIDGTTFAPPGPAQCGTPSSGGSGGSGGSGAGGGASGGKSSNGSGGKASGGSSNAGGTGAGGMSGAARGGSSNTGGGGKSGGGTTGSNGKGGAASGGSSPGGSANGGAASGGQTATVGASGGAGSGGASAGGSGPIAGVPNGGSSNSGGTQAASGGVKASHSGSVGLPGSTDSSGCTCSMEPGAPHRSAWSLVGLMSVGLVLRRRRR